MSKAEKYLTDNEISNNIPMYFDAEPYATVRSEGFELGAIWARDLMQSRIEELERIAFGEGSAQERMEEIKQALKTK